MFAVVYMGLTTSSCNCSLLWQAHTIKPASGMKYGWFCEVPLRCSLSQLL